MPSPLHGALENKHCIFWEPRGSEWEDHWWCKPHFLGEWLITGMIAFLSPEIQGSWTKSFKILLMQMEELFSNPQTRCPSQVFALFLRLKEIFISSKAIPSRGATHFAQGFWSQFKEQNHFLLIQFVSSLKGTAGLHFSLEEARVYLFWTHSLAWGQSLRDHPQRPDPTNAISYQQWALQSIFQHPKGLYLWRREVRTVSKPRCPPGIPLLKPKLVPPQHLLSWEEAGKRAPGRHVPTALPPKERAFRVS